MPAAHNIHTSHTKNGTGEEVVGEQELKLSTLWKDMVLDKDQRREFRLFWYPTMIPNLKSPVTTFHEQLEAGMPMQDRYVQDYYKFMKRTHSDEFHPHIEKLDEDSETVHADPHVFQIYENCIDRKSLASSALLMGGVFLGWNSGIAYWGRSQFTRGRMLICTAVGMLAGYTIGNFIIPQRVESCFEQIVNHEVSNMIIDRDYGRMVDIAKSDRRRALHPLPALQFEHSNPEMQERERQMHREHVRRALRASRLIEAQNHQSTGEKGKEYRLVTDPDQPIHEYAGVQWIDPSDSPTLQEFLHAAKDRKRSHYRKEFLYI